MQTAEAAPASEALTVHLQGPLLSAVGLLSVQAPDKQRQSVIAFLRPSSLVHLLPLSTAGDGSPSFQV